jgi:hypothetical protein
MKRQMLFVWIASMLGIAGCKEEVSAVSSGIETVCSAEIVQRWAKLDANNQPIWEDYIKVDMAVNFGAVDEKFDLAKDRPNYLKTPAVAVIGMKDGSEITLVDSVFYGFDGGKFVPQQTYFEKSIDKSKVADGLPIKCFVGG